MSLYRFWLSKTWPAVKLWGRIQCLLNRHDWIEAAQLDKRGQIEPLKAGRFRRCRRPSCQILQGDPRLHDFGQWIETDDFMVLVKKSCPTCYGRGYSGRMNMAEGVKVKVPCKCLIVQPAYLERTMEEK